MFKQVCVLFIFVYFLSCNVQADSDMEDLQKKYLANILECAVENPLTLSDLEELKNHKMPDKQNVKCLFACAYKKAGMMNNNGELDVEGVREISKKHFGENSEKMKMSEKFTEACQSVNDVAVSDGSKGCERAALIFDCSIKKTPEFDLVA